MWIDRAACTVVLLSAAIAAGCARGNPAANSVETSSQSSTDRAGTLSVSAFRFSGWHDENFHYLPALWVTAPSTGRPVFVERVDFTAEDAGNRRLLKGVRYAAAQPVQPGGTIQLVPDVGDPTEIASPVALDSISAIVFFTDQDGQTGIVSSAAEAPDLPHHASLTAVAIHQFAVSRRQHQGRFVYWPKLTLAETSGRSRASIKKIEFELLDAGAAGQSRSFWTVPDIQAGNSLDLVTGKNGGAPWFEIESSANAARVSVMISFVDEEGRGGRVTAISPVGQ